MARGFPAANAALKFPSETAAHSGPQRGIPIIESA